MNNEIENIKNEIQDLESEIIRMRKFGDRYKDNISEREKKIKELNLKLMELYDTER